MKKTTPLSHLSLTPAQAERLSRYCAMYRRVLLQGQAPSLRRNQVIRAAQAVQGRLCGRPACIIQEEPLLLVQEDVHTLQQVLVGLLRQQRTTSACEQRTALLGDLAEALVLLHRGGSPVERSQQG